MTKQVEKDEPLSPESDQDDYVQIQPQVIFVNKNVGGIIVVYFFALNCIDGVGCDLEQLL